MNAKKLDIDFDGDDFFNSFEPGTQSEKGHNNNGVSPNPYVTRLQEVNDPFDIAKPQ